jgi:hypothetical protein
VCFVEQSPNTVWSARTCQSPAVAGTSHGLFCKRGREIHNDDIARKHGGLTPSRSPKKVFSKSLAEVFGGFQEWVPKPSWVINGAG